MRLIAVDTGETRSATVTVCGVTPVSSCLAPNLEVLAMLEADELADLLVVEMMTTQRRKAVGRSTFLAMLWAGRFIQCWRPRPYRLVYRKTAVGCITGDSRSGDSDVRRALIRRFGGHVAKQPGGVLRGYTSHHMAALAVGLAVVDRTVAVGFDLEVGA